MKTEKQNSHNFMEASTGVFIKNSSPKFSLRVLAYKIKILSAFCLSFFIFTLPTYANTAKTVNDWKSFAAVYQAGTDDIVFSKSIMAGDGADALGKTNAESFKIDGGKLELNSNFINDLGFVFIEGENISFKDINFIKFNDSSGDGGVIYSSGASFFFSGGISFASNTAKSMGGALFAYNNSSFAFTNATVLFVGNTAETVGGGAVFAYNNANISFMDSNISFTSNAATGGGGGALNSYYANISFSKLSTSFVGNTAGNMGGAILANGSKISFVDMSAEFINNTAGAQGGAINGYKSDISFSNSSVLFAINKADKFGSAILADNDSNISFVNSTASFSENIGEAVSAVNSNFSFANSQISFIGNNAEGAAAAILAVKSKFSFGGSAISFMGNIAGGGGGSILAYDSSLSFINSKVSFIGNIAKNTGGAVYLRHGAKLIFANSQITFKDNKANEILGDVYFYDANTALVFSGDNTLTDGIKTNGKAAAKIIILDRSKLIFAGGESDLKNKINFEGADAAIIFSKENTLTSGLNTTGSTTSIIQISKDATLIFSSDSNAKNIINNFGNMIFKSGNSHFGFIDVSSDAVLYLKKSSDSHTHNTKLTVDSMVLKKDSALSFEIDFENKTAPELILMQEPVVEKGAKLEIINLTPDAPQTEIIIISVPKSFDWKKFAYDTKKYKVSFKKGKLSISNKPIKK
jgi:predicted outer membrane repeat protein